MSCFLDQMRAGFPSIHAFTLLTAPHRHRRQRRILHRPHPTLLLQHACSSCYPGRRESISYHTYSHARRFSRLIGPVHALTRTRFTALREWPLLQARDPSLHQLCPRGVRMASCSYYRDMHRAHVPSSCFPFLAPPRTPLQQTLFRIYTSVN